MNATDAFKVHKEGLIAQHGKGRGSLYTNP